MAFPNSPSPLISLSLAGQYVTLQTSFGLRVRWDGSHYAQISVPRLVKTFLEVNLTHRVRMQHMHVAFFLMRFLVTLVKNCPDWLNKE